MKRFHDILLLAFVSAIIASCTTARQLSYLTDMKYNQDYLAQPVPELVVMPDDRLEIHVLSEAQELSKPFNLFLSDEGGAGGENNLHSYQVDKLGCIEFPVLGTVTVAGLTLEEVKHLISSRIKDLGYIKVPIVTVRLENFTVTVIGNTGNMVIPVKENSINLLQVLAQIGGTDEYSDIRNLTVIRTENGQRRAYQVNLQTKELFNSPVFYLRQQDVVYVKPKGSRPNTSWQVAMSILSSGISIASLVATVRLLSR